MPLYRFANFSLSPRRRLLLRDGRELPLIPRYFDLLVFLIERRHEAVHAARFDRVWNDVIVSDSALSQAIRTLRRALDDDPREPRFIRTVSRHGYQFVFTNVVEESDSDGGVPRAPLAALVGPRLRQAAGSTPCSGRVSQAAVSRAFSRVPQADSCSPLRREAWRRLPSFPCWP